MNQARVSGVVGRTAQTGDHHGISISQLFESTVAAADDDAPAVIFEDTSITYKVLNDKANRLARILIAQGVGPEALVAVAIPRSIELVVAVLGVLKASGAYLPVDPDYPVSRIAHMLDDARPALLLRSRSVALDSVAIPEIVVDDDAFVVSSDAVDGTDLTVDERPPVRMGNLAYTIYTSGSTGTPKGVSVTHEGLMGLIDTQLSSLGPLPGDRVLQWASISFDAALWDFTLGLLSGATLVMASADDLLPGEPLRETLMRHSVTYATLPPVALSGTDDDGVLIGGTIISTGDAFTQALARKWCPGRRVFNGYGPTEMTVGATLAGPIIENGEISIGMPWDGNRVHVLDDLLRLTPSGIDGELYLAGTGIARGYLKRPGLTASRFVADPAGPPGARMYRSGDRGSYAEGEYFFTGRGDDQVKLRGFRVELGEIEACLACHPTVALAAVSVHGMLEDSVIVAYVTPSSKEQVPTERALRDHVSQRLPRHMVPSAVVVLEQLPTTPNGKIDRRALPAPPQWIKPPENVPAPPSNTDPQADVVYRIIAELVSVPLVRPEDNLHELGGNSLTVARLGTRIRRELGVQLPIRTIMEAATLFDIAAAMAEALATEVPEELEA